MTTFIANTNFLCLPINRSEVSFLIPCHFNLDITLYITLKTVFFFFSFNHFVQNNNLSFTHKKKTIHYVVKKVKPFIYFYYILNVTINKNYLA